MSAIEKLIQQCDKYEYDDDGECLHNISEQAMADLAALTARAENAERALAEAQATIRLIEDSGWSKP
jgi:hypothetical protein